MMAEDFRTTVLRHAKAITLIGTSALLALSLFALAGSVFGDDQASADEQAHQLISSLKGDLSTAQDDLDSAHDTVMSDLSGVDVERADRDRSTGRSILLSLIDSSASMRTVKQEQLFLDARYDFFDEDSRTLTEFLPAWMAATGASHGVGTTYMIADLQIDVRDVSGLDYSYIGVARLDPVRTEGASAGKSEFVVFTYATTQDGTVTDLQAQRLSSRSRDALVKAMDEGEQNTDQNEKTSD